MNLTLKFVFIGDAGAGKTAINHKFITGKFDEFSNPTIGVIFSCKQYKSKKYKNPIKVQFWDTAGQERFRSIAPMYYRGSSAILLVYDITSRHSFDNIVKYWADLIEKENCFKIYLIGNKTDLEENRQVSLQEGLTFAQQHNFVFHEISAKDDDLEILLSEIVTSVCDQIAETKIPVDKLKFYGINIEAPQNDYRYISGCC